MAADDWTTEEVAATVADYFVMLDHELRGEQYNKREHDRRLQALLRDRSAGAIEFKHANISAVLIELGFPYIDGYKPRGNYQDLLKAEVAGRLASNAGLISAAQTVVDAPAPTPAPPASLADVIVEPPKRDPESGPAPTGRAPIPRKGVNYLELEARNRSLGLAGELFALAVERRRLIEAGKPKLADLVEHVSQTRGDGLGFDILSFEPSGKERFIEVKTTSFGQMTPFYASRHEVAMSEENAAHFNLYRLFKFREQPRMFMLAGSLRDTCVLDPNQYRAAPR